MPPLVLLLAALHRTGCHHLSLSKLADEAVLTERGILPLLDRIEEMGGRLEVHPHLGCRLIQAPDRLVVEDLQARLLMLADKGGVPLVIGRCIRTLTETGSTNDVVRELARNGEPGGTVVFAEKQTSGRGRQGRSWCSPKGKGLWFSVLLRPRLGAQEVGRLTVMTGVAVARALEEASGLPLQLKWPNDVLCRRRKLCGILVETQWIANGGLDYAVVGVGINVNVEAADLPGDLRGKTTSLRIEAGREWHLPALVADVLWRMEKERRRMEGGLFGEILSEWASLDCTLGRQVRLREYGAEVRGLAAGMDPTGGLLIRTDDGRMMVAAAGEVVFEEAAKDC